MTANQYPSAVISDRLIERLHRVGDVRCFSNILFIFSLVKGCVGVN